MKRLITIMALGAVLLAQGEEIKKLRMDSTIQDVLDIKAKMDAATSPEQFYSLGNRNGIFTSWSGMRSHRPDLQSTMSALDESWAAMGRGVTYTYFKSWPKMAAVSQAKGMNPTNNVLFETAAKYDCDALPYPLGDKATAEEFVAVMDWWISHPHNFDIDMLNKYKGAFQSKYGLKLVKKMLYRQGKSFVSKDGVNPCQEMVTRLTVSLNAPRLAGFNEWLDDVGVSHRISLDFLPSADKAEELKMDVLVGEQEPSKKNLYTLYLCLGVDEYNKFIKRFNGESE